VAWCGGGGGDGGGCWRGSRSWCSGQLLRHLSGLTVTHRPARRALKSSAELSESADMASRVWRRERGPARPAVCVPCRACAWVSRRETGSFMVVLRGVSGRQNELWECRSNSPALPVRTRKRTYCTCKPQIYRWPKLLRAFTPAPAVQKYRRHREFSSNAGERTVTRPARARSKLSE